MGSYNVYLPLPPLSPSITVFNMLQITPLHTLLFITHTEKLYTSFRVGPEPIR